MRTLIILLCLYSLSCEEEQQLQPMLGISMAPVTLGNAIDSSIAPDKGVLIHQIRDMPISIGQGRLQPGDIIYQIDGQWTSPLLLRDQLQHYEAGAEVTLQIFRHRQRFNIAVSVQYGRLEPLAMDRIQKSISANMQRYESILAAGLLDGKEPLKEQDSSGAPKDEQPEAPEQ